MLKVWTFPTFRTFWTVLREQLLALQNSQEVEMESSATKRTHKTHRSTKLNDKEKVLLNIEKSS